MDWTASWIWHPPKADMDNLYVYARRTFDLADVPPGARAFVTAGSLYKLYVNGRYVGRGPNPSDPSRYYYDVHPLAKFLRPGKNVVAAVCYNYGAETKGILGQNWGRGGFLLEIRAAAEGDAEGDVLLATDGAWKVLQAPEWRQDAPVNCTLLGDYKEVYDSRAEVPGWMEASFDDAGWTAPDVLGRPPVEPYSRLVEREIPALGGERVHPVNVHWESASVTYAWRDDWEIYHEHRLVPGSPHYDGEKPVEITRTHDDFTPSLTLDFGRIVTGYPRIRVRDSGGGIVDVLYGEGLHMVRVDRFILKGGPQVLAPFNRRTFRYMKLQFPETPGRITLDAVEMSMNAYPVSHVGAFSCADPLLDRIWDVGRHTMRLSMLDHFVDCPWRERTIYGGDVYAENLIAHYAFGDPRMNRKVLRQMFAIQHEAGALPPYGPYRGCDSFYPSWSAYFGLAFVDHYLLTGDRAFLEELWPRFARLLDWAVGELERDDIYLIGDPAKGGSFEDWMRGERVSFGPWVNLPFQALLRRGAELAEELGRRDEAARFGGAAARMAAAVKEHMVGRDGLCVPHGGGARAAAPTRFDSALLLWSGLPECDAGTALAERVFSDDIRPIASPFHGLFLVEGLYGYGEDRKALDFTRRYWGSMLERGATTFWEHFDANWPPAMEPGFGTSYCHGWSAGPTYSLSAHVLGIRPLRPGFAEVLMEPRPGDLDWAKGTVPTPHGPVSVEWHRCDGGIRATVDLPEGSRGRVSLPRLNSSAETGRDEGRLGDRTCINLEPGIHNIGP